MNARERYRELVRTEAKRRFASIVSFVQTGDRWQSVPDGLQLGFLPGHAVLIGDDDINQIIRMERAATAQEMVQRLKNWAAMDSFWAIDMLAKHVAWSERTFLPEAALDAAEGCEAVRAAIRDRPTGIDRLQHFQAAWRKEVGTDPPDPTDWDRPLIHQSEALRTFVRLST